MKEFIHNAFSFSAKDGTLEDLLLAVDTKVDSLNNEYSAHTEEEKDAQAEYQRNFLVQFAHNSSSIEGSTLTPLQTALVVEGEFIPSDDKELHDMFAVKGCYEGYDFMLQALEENRTFDENLIKDIHERTALDCQPRTRGVYRVVPAYITGSKTVPAPALKIREYMADLMFAFNNSSQHPLIRASAFHVVFEAIHPFRDGNGRCGRTVLNYLLLKQGYPAIAIKADNRMEYLKGLEAWQVENNPVPFIKRAIDSVSKEADLMIDTIQQTRECMRSVKVPDKPCRRPSPAELAKNATIRAAEASRQNPKIPNGQQCHSR